MKKFIKYLFVVCLMVPFAFMLSGCNDSAEPANVMKLSVNPEVSFVLDSDNKVVSVKYEKGENGNGDAGTIYADVNFVGKDLDSTIQIFIERAVISGHINLSGDDVLVDVSGEVDVSELQNSIKAKIEQVFTNLGIEVKVDFENATAQARRTALITSASVLAPEKTSLELESMSNEQLVNLISEKQAEYKDLAYTQITTINGNLEKGVQQLLASAKSAFEKAEKALKDAQDDLNNNPDASQIYQPILDSAIQNYNIAKQSFNQCVENFNNAKKQAIENAKAQYEQIKNQLVQNYKNQVELAKTNVISHLDNARQQEKITQEQYDYWINLINSQIQ